MVLPVIVQLLVEEVATVIEYLAMFTNLARQTTAAPRKSVNLEA